MIAKASTTVTSRLIQVDSGTEPDGLSTLIDSSETFVPPTKIVVEISTR